MGAQAFPKPAEMLERWSQATLSHSLPSRKAEDVERLLNRRFKAYEIPLHSISRVDYLNDEFVRLEHVYKLFTITHTEMLASLYNSQDLKLKTGLTADEYDENWQCLFLEYHPDPEDLDEFEDANALVYMLLNIQHSNGQRTSILLEREGEEITSTRVYGQCEYLRSFLLAITGYPLKGSAPELPYSMEPGNLNDELFVDYLKCLTLHKFI